MGVLKLLAPATCAPGSSFVRGLTENFSMKPGSIFRLSERKIKARPSVCGACKAKVNPASLIPHNYSFLCPACFAAGTASQEDVKHAKRYSESGERINATGLTASQMDNLREKADLAQTWMMEILSSLPFLFYLLLYYWSQQSELGKHFFTGYLIADVASWLIRSFVFHKHRPIVLLLHVIAYILVVTLWFNASGELKLPEHPADRGVVLMTAMAVFSMKLVALVLHGLFGEKR